MKLNNLTNKILNNDINVFKNSDYIKIIYKNENFKVGDIIEIFNIKYIIVEEVDYEFDTDFVFNNRDFNVSTYKIHEIEKE